MRFQARGVLEDIVTYHEMNKTSKHNVSWNYAAAWECRFHVSQAIRRSVWDVIIIINNNKIFLWDQIFIEKYIIVIIEATIDREMGGFNVLGKENTNGRVSVGKRESAMRGSFQRK